MPILALILWLVPVLSRRARDAPDARLSEIDAVSGLKEEELFESQGASVSVQTEIFYRAETDDYFRHYVKVGAFGRFRHARAPTVAGSEKVPRMQQDTLYSIAVVDLQAGPVTVELPVGDGRFQSLMPMSEDHDIFPAAYGPGSFTFSQETVGTRYMAFIVRTFVVASDPADVSAANSVQDNVVLRRVRRGFFRVPNWNQEDLKQIREAARTLSLTSSVSAGEVMGLRQNTDALSHLMAVAAAWGGNQKQDAVYLNPVLGTNVGDKPHAVTVSNVPLQAKGFWSITVYGPSGFMIPNERGINSFNSETAQPNADGSVTINFGCPEGGEEKVNCLPIVDKWNFCVRMYMPGPEILSGEWQFPEVVPV